MKNNRTFLEKLLDGAEVEWKPLIKVASLTRGRVISKEYLADNLGDYPVYSSQTVNNGEIGKINSFDFDGEFVSWTTDGANAGTVFYRSGKFSITNVCGLIKIQNNLELNYKFLFYWLSIEAKNHVYSGMGNPKLMSHQMEKILIPIPPLSVQTEIVKILDALTALTSELTSELTLRRKQYEYYREKLLSEEELEKVGFEWKTLGDVAKIQRGASPRPISQYITDEPNGIPWIKIGDTSLDSKYIENTAQKITVEGAEKSRILKCGDFVMSNSMSYGRPYILKISGAIHDGWASISDFENILNSDFLYYYLSSDSVQSYWNGKINSSSVSNLNSDIIKSLPIPIPALHIQIEIAKTLDKFETLINSISKGLPLAIEQSQKRYEYYRELLLNFS